MVNVLKLLLVGPAVTPEDVCVPRDVFQPAVMMGRAVRLQLSVLVIAEPCGLRRLGHFIALDEEEFGFSGQSRAGVRHEVSTDAVQVESRTVRVGTEQLERVETADDAADEGVHSAVLGVSGDVLQAGKDFSGAQQHMEAHGEVKARE